MVLHDLLDFQARSRGSTCFAICDGKRLTYAEASTRADRMAAALQSLGLGPGKRFGYLSINSIDNVIVYFAAAKIGAVPVPLNWRLAPREWAFILKDATAEIVLSQQAFCAALDQAEAETGKLQKFSLDAPVAGWSDFEALMTKGPAKPAPVDISPDDVLYQMYTSGTTGHPKGALLSHRSVICNLMQGTMSAPYRLNPGDRVLLVLPLFHAAAGIAAFTAIAVGGTLVIHKEFVPLEVIRALQEDKIVSTTMVPSVLQFMLVGVPGIDEMKFPHLRVVTYGAAPISEAVLRHAMKVFGAKFTQAYGMTELSAGATSLSEEDHEKALAGRPELLLSAGRPMPWTEVRIEDAEGNVLPAGEVGEICVRGPQMMIGYWARPEASAEAMRGGWMHTGDAGSMDEEGYVYVRDRIKDMIVSGGENIYPNEVEAALYEHPNIAECAVIGVPDEKWGEAVMGVIATRDGQEIATDVLVAFCRERLGGYKIPKKFVFIKALPRNPSGKVLKRELRAPYWEGKTRQVS